MTSLTSQSRCLTLPCVISCYSTLLESYSPETTSANGFLPVAAPILFSFCDFVVWLHVKVRYIYVYM